MIDVKYWSKIFVDSSQLGNMTICMKEKIEPNLQVSIGTRNT